MFVDASVIIAIMTSEPDAEFFAAHIDAARTKRPVTSVLAVWEATVGLYRKKRIPMNEAEARVQEFIEAADIHVLSVGSRDLPTALQAFERYGRHRYPDAERNSALNLADCFHYAAAKSCRAPILTKDGGFALTDVATIGVDPSRATAS
ncbi:ribonuclease VapC [Rhodoblastus acidophilus]|uniref:Ribonuclease VapC n=1 Tax=Rhodoblastus acidophilus TaxID=1074 RepID=A0A212SCB8_RHOAC|nr:type II toxin-antitoxin system VapC family toxin [Rhodoblastus acidophilus]PPQ35333.1 PIN domain-containing protein [Rhodoblastus acidophilus]RAI16957.1 PIN domain-containing protein [Rhodoblastus acidophilus]SNB83220.1 ribonuclease VapC [Rhodoblastus acidophilus]